MIVGINTKKIDRNSNINNIAFYFFKALLLTAPGLAQLQVICSFFQPGNKVVKKALVSINHQNRNCSQAGVSGQALYPGRLMCMKSAFLLDLQDLKDALIFLAGKYFQTWGLRPFP